jgi:hypothetical protein
LEYSCKATVRVAHEASKSLLEAVNPDNIHTPQWLSINCRSLPDMLECVVEVDCSNPTRILSLRNTLDELLRAIKTGINAIESSRHLKP